MSTSRQSEATAFAHFIKGLGFRVYMAAQGDYGFITDETESRVLSFGFSITPSLSGNYGPPSTTSGTGWRVDATPNQLQTADDVKRALYAHPPAFCGGGWKYLTNVKQHLVHYGASSKYTQI